MALPIQEPQRTDKLLAAQRVLDARTALANVKEMLKDAEAAFFDTTEEDDTIELPDGTLVTRIDTDRRTISADKLRLLLTADTFDRVKKVSVNHKAFDAAVELGIIKDDEVEGAIKRTPYTAIRITKGE